MNTNENNKLAVNASEAAKLLSISPRTLWSLTAPRGPIPAVRLGKRVIYRIADLETFLEMTAKQKGDKDA